MSLSRRGFLAGSAAAAAASPLLAKTPGPRGPEVLGPDAQEIELRINGQTAKLKVEPRTTLLEALRWQVGLTGTKEVCGRGACGACTVMVDGKPISSCLSLAVDAVGKEITTVEGLGTAAKPGPVMAAMAKHDAVQCGYCIPGIVVSLEAARRQNPNADAEALKEAVSGNLCRCGTYSKLFEANERLAGGNPEAGHPKRNAKACLENQHGRLDGPVKLSGEAVYGADVNLPGMLFARHIQCPYGLATLVSADVEAAQRLPGVVEIQVQTGREYNYSGAPAGHICAESPAAVRDALAALRLVWEPEVIESDPQTLYQDKHGDLSLTEEEQSKDARGKRAAEALKDAAVVVEATYQTQIQDHVPLEPHGATVDPTQEPPVAWVSTQGTFTCTEGIARGLGRKRSEIEIRCEYVGGGFGSKFGAGREGLLAATLAGRHKRPVRVFNDREAEHLDAGNRPGSLQWMKIGADKDGKLLGGWVRTAGVTGISGGGGVTNPSRYNFGVVSTDHINLPLAVGASRAFRAPGHPQGIFGVDSMIDEIAEALGKDPLAIRQKNDPSRVRQEMYPEGAKAIGWHRRQASGSQKGRFRRGFGMAVCDWGNRQGRCDVRLVYKNDGKVHLYSGTQDIGQGQHTVLADLAADALGIDRQQVVVHLARSSFPFGPASGGSATARATAMGVRDAAAKLLAKLEQRLGSRPQEASYWTRMASQVSEEGIAAEGSRNQDYWGEGSSEGMQLVELVVDTATGLVQLERIVALQACGLVVNRLTAENQVTGGVIQGISYALFEDKVLDTSLGVQLNADHEHYKIAGALEVPPIETILWPQKDGGGVRSLGEPPTIPTAAAIGNAIANATGARVRTLPITPRRILEALEEQA